jgi:hypothetical protein
VIAKWRNIVILCPDCKILTDLIGACASADGELLYQAICPKCKTKLNWQTFATSIAYYALCEDMKNNEVIHLAPSPAPTPQPPKPLKVELSEEDMIYLHDLGIADDPPETPNPTPPLSAT